MNTITESAVSNGACLRTMLIFLSIIPVRPPARARCCDPIGHLASQREPGRSRSNSLCQERPAKLHDGPEASTVGENGLRDYRGNNMEVQRREHNCLDESSFCSVRVPTCGTRPTLAPAVRTPLVGSPPPNTHLLLWSPRVPERRTPEHLTSTGPHSRSACPPHRRSVTSARLIFSPGYQRLMGRGWGCVGRGGSVLSSAFWSSLAPDPAASARVLKGSGRHAEPSALVSLSVSLPLPRIPYLGCPPPLPAANNGIKQTPPGSSKEMK